jgi:hypothetical protein
MERIAIQFKAIVIVVNPAFLYLISAIHASIFLDKQLNQASTPGFMFTP